MRKTFGYETERFSLSSKIFASYRAFDLISMKTLIVKYAYRMTRVGQNNGINVFVFFLFFATIIVRLHADNPYMENSAGFCVIRIRSKDFTAFTDRK